MRLQDTANAKSPPRHFRKVVLFFGRFRQGVAQLWEAKEVSVIVLIVFGDPPEHFAEDLPLGCVAHVEGKVLGIGGDEQV